jgi:hypothetical protein
VTTTAKRPRPAPAVRADQPPAPRGLAPYLDRLRQGGWRAAGAFLAITLVTLLVLIILLKKTNPSHLTIGAGMVMLLYLAVGGFLVLASLIFVPRRGR